VAEPPSLDVVIVAYRCRELLRRCLDALLANPAQRQMTVTVVDNDSRDGTVEMVRADYPQVRLFASDTNLGFSAANNRAIRASGGDYVLALNPDTEVTPGALERLCALLDERPEVGIVGPALEQADGTPDHAAKRSFPTPLSALGHFTGLGRRRESGTLAAYRAPDVAEGPVDAVNGAFMLMRRRALDRVGLFDEGYWMYMEDLDLSYRFAEAGWVTWYEPAVTVHHLKAGTSGKHRSPRLNYAFHYGMLRFYRSHYAPQRSPLLNAAVYAGIAVKLAAALARSALGRLGEASHSRS
jgi:N-acetylglucosaminyl-diphospho-decaprenol L-rhamnosyltransferase